MSRRKIINVLALLLTAGYVTLVLLAPASVTALITHAVVVGLLIACLVATVRAANREQRAADRTPPNSDDHPQPPSP